MLRRVVGAAVALVIPAAVLVGCGSSEPTRPKVCELKAQRAIAADLDLSSTAIAYAKSVGTNGMPQCAFTAHDRGHKVVVLVNVDNGPQPYFRLLRTVDEASQLFGPPPPGFHAPIGLNGLGPFASWFVNNHQLMATNKIDLLTVTVSWPEAARKTEIKLASAAVVPYLANPHGRGKAEDFP